MEDFDFDKTPDEVEIGQLEENLGKDVVITGRVSSANYKENVAFMNLAYDITPHCDCADYGDVPMVPDIGIFASKDPIAIDRATSEAIINSPGIKGSAAEEIEAMNPGDDKIARLSEYDPFKAFVTLDGTKNWRIQYEMGEKAGIGSQDYELIKQLEKN